MEVYFLSLRIFCKYSWHNLSYQENSHITPFIIFHNSIILVFTTTTYDYGTFDNIINTAKSSAGKANGFLQGSFDKALTSLIPGQGSNWQGLSNHLIARFYPVVSVGNGKDRRYVQDMSELPVFAPILDGAEMEYQLNWQSPFEQMGTEAKAPALTAMLQSGMLSDFTAQFTRSVGNPQGGESSAQDKGKLQSALKILRGARGSPNSILHKLFQVCRRLNVL